MVQSVGGVAGAHVPAGGRESERRTRCKSLGTLVREQGGARRLRLRARRGEGGEIPDEGRGVEWIDKEKTSDDRMSL